MGAQVARPVPYAGAVLGVVGFALAIVAIWTEPENEAWGKAMGTIFTVAVAGAAGSLLALAQLAPRRTWIFSVTLLLLALGTAMVGVLPWLGDDPGEVYVRALGVVMIVLAALPSPCPSCTGSIAGRLPPPRP